MNPPNKISPLPPGLSRRTVLGASVVGAAGLLTAACGGSSGGTDTSAGSKTSAATDPTPSSAASSAGSGASATLVATSDVPVGGGVFVENGKVVAKPNPQEKLTAVVTQPTAGEFKAFSTTCTHMGCTVTTIKSGTIICPCHGSAYKISDGSTTVNPESGAKGPAPSPLTSIAVKVDGANVVKA